MSVRRSAFAVFDHRRIVISGATDIKAYFDLISERVAKETCPRIDRMIDIAEDFGNYIYGLRYASYVKELNEFRSLMSSVRKDNLSLRNSLAQALYHIENLEQQLKEEQSEVDSYLSQL